MIYATPFDPTTKQCTGPSMPSGFNTIEDVVSCMGPPIRQGATSVVYGDATARVIFSKAIFSIDEADSTE